MTKKTIKKAAKKTTTKKTATSKTKTSEKRSAKKKSPTAKKKNDEAAALASFVVKGMQEKKAKNITILDLRGISNRVSDFFVISDADSTTHVNSIAGSVEETVKKNTGERPFHSEGWENAQWILMDYVNVVSHVFLRETREFYNLESLWADAEVEHIK